MNTPTTETIYEQLGISKEVWAFGQKTEEKLKERFEEFDRNAEYNQLKVIHAMQENRVSEGCFNYVSGYGYNDQGRDTLEDVYASVFHTEAALVRPQITCGTHALALALAANLRPGDTLLSPVGKPYDTLEEVIGIRPEYNHFGTMHILNSKKGTYFLADTLINRHPDASTLIDIAKLADQTVRFFNHTPVIAMLSYSNFGSDQAGSPLKVHEAVAYMQKEYPELAIDGEMQVNFAMNRELRDTKYPFTRLKGKDVNTLIFPNLSSANAGYKLLQAMDPDTEFIGPIQMGLNKPIHFTDFESSVRDIVNITAVAVIDAIVDKKKKEG